MRGVDCAPPFADSSFTKRWRTLCNAYMLLHRNPTGLMLAASIRGAATFYKGTHICRTACNLETAISAMAMGIC